MYRVLIVDDEPWVAYGISKLIDWEGAGFTLIGEAFDGLSAIAQIKDQQPDVVVSDIRMPGLDGIELLEAIQSLQLDTEVILVSGYSEFEYARQALRLGAFDYLLKQIDKEKLTETLHRLRSKLERKQRQSDELDVFLSDLFELFDADSKLTISHFLANKGYGFDDPHFRIVNGLYPYSTVSESSASFKQLEGLKCIFFRTGQNKRSILMNYDADRNPAVPLDFITENLAACTSLGMSPIGQSSSSLSKLYQEADIALFSSVYQPGSRMLEYKEAEPNMELPGSLLQLELAIKEQKKPLIQEKLTFICGECMRLQLFLDQIASIYNQIVSMVHKYYGTSTAWNEIEFLTYNQAFRQYGSAEQLFERLKAIFELEPETELTIWNEQVKAIMAYIDDKFTEDIMLGSIAKQFNISLSYLSFLLKKETGKTYSEYIAAKRLTLAKELLADSSLSIQEVVQRVGYKDYFHFNKLFKKHYGITPSKFRKI